METDTHVRCGVVGLGNIGHHHADRLVENDTAQLVGGVDVAAEARDQFADAYDVETFASFDDLVDYGVDALVVGTPNKFHEQYVVDALDADIPVLCEKPLAHTLDSAKRIGVAETASDAFCMVGFNNRFAAAADHAITARDNGEFGEITHIEANFIRRRGVPGRGSWFTRNGLAGGGSLIDIGVHALDLSLHLADHPCVKEVSGTTRTQFGNREDYTYETMWGDDNGPGAFDVDDSVSAFIRCTDDVTISLEVAWATNRDPSEDIRLRGTDGGARFELGGSDLTIFDVNRDADAETPLPTRPRELETQNSHAIEQDRFLQAVATGEPPEWNTVDQALQVQRVIDAIYRSSEQGQAVQLTR